MAKLNSDGSVIKPTPLLNKVFEEKTVTLLFNSNPSKTGLVNLGNTCYANVILQSLANNYFFPKFVMQSWNPHKKSQSKLISPLSSFFKKYLSAKYSAIRPETLIKAMQKQNPSLKPWQQHDAHEFFTTLINLFHEEVAFLERNQLDSNRQRRLKLDFLHSFYSRLASFGNDSNSSKIGQNYQNICQHGQNNDKTSHINGQNNDKNSEKISEKDKNNTENTKNVSKDTKKGNWSPDVAAVLAQFTGRNFGQNMENEVKLKEAFNTIKVQVENKILRLEKMIQNEDQNNQNSQNGKNGNQNKENVKKISENIDDKNEQNGNQNNQNGQNSSKNEQNSQNIGQKDIDDRLDNFMNKFLRMPLMQREKRHSIIKDLFFGTLVGEVICSECKRVSHTENLFSELSLQIPRSAMTTAEPGIFKSIKSLIWGSENLVSLKDCLDCFFMKEGLGESNLYFCSFCKIKVIATKRYYINKAPEILTLHIKRFSMCKNRGSKKLLNIIDFPFDDLNIKEYLFPQNNSSDLNLVNEKLTKNTPKTSNYRLSSLVIHEGDGHSGHYKCYCRDSNSGKWQEFSDRFVKFVDPKIIKEKQAYILFYERVQSSSHIERNVDFIQKILNNENGENDEKNILLSKQWLLKALLLDSPGPVNNRELFCRHGNLTVAPQKLSNCSLAISETQWNSLCDRFNSKNNQNLIEKSSKIDQNSKILAKIDQNSIKTDQNSEKLTENDQNLIEKSSKNDQNSEILIEKSSKNDQNLQNLSQNDKNFDKKSFEMSKILKKSEKEMDCIDCEKDELQNRKNREGNEVINFEENYQLSKKSVTFVISERWMAFWRSFVSNETDIVPGPIHNQHLLDENGRILMDLELEKDYRIVSEEVWRYLHGIYKGGPEIVNDFKDEKDLMSDCGEH